MKSIKLLLTAVLCIMATVGMAQDKLYLKTERNPLNVKVLEVGPNEIKVVETDNEVIQVFETLDVYKIVYANGRVQKFESEIEPTMDRYRDMNINAFSIDVVSPLQDFVRVSYDRVIKPGLSYELAASFIGLDEGRILAQSGLYDQNTGQYNVYKELYQGTRGFRLEGGVKAIRLPNFVNGRVRYRHLLQGSYFKPWLAIENVSQKYVDSVFFDQNTGRPDWTESRRAYTAFNIGTDFGRSWVARNRFLVDVYFGIGYSLSNFKKINTEPVLTDGADYEDFFYSFYDDYRGYGYTRTQPNKTGSFILRFGVKMGYVFNWKKDAEKNFYKDQ